MPLMGGEFSVVRHLIGDRLFLDVYGELDTAVADVLREAVETAIASHDGPAVLDLGRLEMVTSTGLEVLLAVAEAARNAGFDLTLRPPSAEVLRIFEIAGVRQRLFPGEADAETGA